MKYTKEQINKAICNSEVEGCFFREVDGFLIWGDSKEHLNELEKSVKYGNENWPTIESLLKRPSLFKRKRGSGSKENVGRPKLPFENKVLVKRGVPLAVYSECLEDIKVITERFKLTGK